MSGGGVCKDLPMMERNRKNTPWWETCVKQVALGIESSPNGLNRNEAAARRGEYNAAMEGR
jgi:hypothetical protein